MINPQLRQKLQEKKSKVGLVGGSLKITEYDEAEQNIKATSHQKVGILT